MCPEQKPDVVTKQVTLARKYDRNFSPRTPFTLLVLYFAIHFFLQSFPFYSIKIPNTSPFATEEQADAQPYVTSYYDILS